MIPIATNIIKTTLISICCLICLFSCSEITERNMAYELHGIDISRYQGNINWDQVESDTVHFVFMKATEGGDYQDPNYINNWKSSQGKNFKRGAYHFFLPKTSTKEQIDNFYLNSKLAKGDLPPVVDFETTQGLQSDQIQDRLSDMLEGLEGKYSVKPIIYTNLKLYFGYIAGRFDQYPIWIARYGDRSPNLSSQFTWTFWQYAKNGRINGIKGNVDLNVFRGSNYQLEAMCLKEDPYSAYDAF